MKKRKLLKAVCGSAVSALLVFQNLFPVLNVLADEIEEPVDEPTTYEITVEDTEIPDVRQEEINESEETAETTEAEEAVVIEETTTDKSAAIKGGICNKDFLLDDYTLNLSDWEPPARGIKILNYINGTKGKWQSNRIASSRPAHNLSDCIYKIMQGETIIDVPPQLQHKAEIGKER